MTTVVAEWWRRPDAEDVAFLQLDGLLSGLFLSQRFFWFLAISCGCNRRYKSFWDANPAIWSKWLVILLADFLITAPNSIL
jgi:hypothetical protein